MGLGDGARLPFRIEKMVACEGAATRGVTAFHPITGEWFSGTYTGTLSSTSTSTRVYSPESGSINAQTRQGNPTADAPRSLGP